MEKLGDMIRNFSGDTKIKSRIAEARAISAWNNVVGETILLNAVPVRIKVGILYVCVKTASWAQELKGLEPVIVKRINEYLGLEIVKEVRFFQGSISSINIENREIIESGDSESEIKLVDITRDEKDKINDFTREIENNDLKDIFKRMLEKDTKLQKWRVTKNQSLNQVLPDNNGQNKRSML